MMCCAIARFRYRPRMPGTAVIVLRCRRMQYVVYFAVVTPLLFVWLFWQAATMPPQAPLFASGYERMATQSQKFAKARAAAPAVTKKLAKNETPSAN